MALVGKTNVPARYLPTVLAAAAKHGVPAAFLAAQIDAESGFNPDAVSPAGAIGIAQFMPATAKSIGLDPHDADASIYAMAKLMAYYKREYGSWEKALYAYHDGPGKVDNPGQAGIAYAKSILDKVKDIVDDIDIPNPLAPLTETQELLEKLGDPDRWKRVGLYVLGGLLVLAGIFLLMRKPLMDAAGTVIGAKSGKIKGQ